MFCRHSKQQTSSEDTLAVKAKYRRKRPSVIRDTDEQVAPALMKSTAWISKHFNVFRTVYSTESSELSIQVNHLNWELTVQKRNC